MSTHLPSHRTARGGDEDPSPRADLPVRVTYATLAEEMRLHLNGRHGAALYADELALSEMDLRHAEAHISGLADHERADRSAVRPLRVFEIRPYTYTDRGVASLGYELVDDGGARIGIFDDVPAARRASDLRGAAVRLSWDAS